MPDRFDKFSENARRTLTFAQEEAQQLNHNYIGTEHILLGLLRLPDCVAARILTGLGVELPQVRSAVAFIIGTGDAGSKGEIGLTPRAKKVIELAVDEARRMTHHHIGTEHILLALVREGEGIAASVLESLNVNLEKARTELGRELGSAGRAPRTKLFAADIGPEGTIDLERMIASIMDETQKTIDDALADMQREVFRLLYKYRGPEPTEGPDPEAPP